MSSEQVHENTCNICKNNSFSVMGRRSDGQIVIQCDCCGMGVVEVIPDDLGAFYGDGYYNNNDALGYTDYATMAEHGVAWAAAFIKCLKPNGRVLDIGCVDGTLLSRLGQNYEKFGIEVNKAMATRAGERGVNIISDDLFAKGVGTHYGSFDIVTSIAVFEHLRDFRGGVERSLALLKNDGILIFEVPLISDVHDNGVWLTSSLEHIYYPRESALKHLVGSLGTQLAGGEIYLRDYGSTYIGLLSKDPVASKLASALFARLCGDTDHLPNEAEREARLQLRLIHAATSTERLINDLGVLPITYTPSLVHRIQQLWSADVRRLNHFRTSLSSAEQNNKTLQETLTWHVSRTTATDKLLQDASDIAKAALARQEALEEELCESRLLLTQAKRDITALQRDAETAEKDRRVNVAQLLRGIAAAEARCAAAVKQAAVLQEDRDAVTAELHDVLKSNLWKSTIPIQHLARRFPKASSAGRSGLQRLWRSLHLRSIFSRTIQDRGARLNRLEPPTPGTVSPLNARYEAPSNPGSGSYKFVDSDVDLWPLEKPLVSVVIPCFNYGHFVEEAIESVLKQTLTDLEIIVVEGGSTALATRQRVSELNYPKTRVLYQDKANRAGANRNFGISRARGKYVCCLDADDKLDPTYLEKAVFLIECYRYHVVSTSLRFFGNRVGTFKVLEQPGLEDLLQSNQVLTCAVFRKDYWSKAGGYHDFYHPEGHIHEDWAFWVRLAAIGARFFNIKDEYLFQYRIHGPSLSNTQNLPLERQIEVIKTFNSDVLNDTVLETSRAAAATDNTTYHPPTNLTRLGRAADFGRNTVLIAMPFTVIGGAERLLSGVVRFLNQRGWRVILITTVAVGAEHGDTTDWFSDATCEIYHFPRFLSQDRWAGFLRYLLEAKRVQLLWIAGSTFVYDLLPELKTDFPHLRIVDILFNTVGHTTNNRKHAQSINLNIVESKEVYNWLVAQGEVESCIQMIESGVDLQHYIPLGKNRELLQGLGISEGMMVVGFSGRWSEEKDPIGFVEIAARTRSPNVVFLMTGTGQMRGPIEDAIRAAGILPDRFFLVGAVPDVLPYIASYDLLCLPSKLDGRPVVVLEALAMGVPVLASDVGALPELIDVSVNGFLVKPRDYDSFARYIDELASDPDKLEALKKNARFFAEKRLDNHEMLMRYESALFTALHG